MDLFWSIAVAVLSAAFAAGGAYMAVRIELKFHRRDIDRNRDSIIRLEDRHRGDVRKLHDKVDRLRGIVP